MFEIETKHIRRKSFLKKNKKKKIENVQKVLFPINFLFSNIKQSKKKRFTLQENVSGKTQAKQSVCRGIRNSIIEQYPKIESVIDDIFPKKSVVTLAKCKDHIQLIIIEGEILFYQIRDGPFYPTLKLLHKYPFIMNRVQVDKGAIRFVLGGANIMCPGLTHPTGGFLPEENLAVGTPVAIFAEGKQNAMAIGSLLMDIQTM